MKIFKGSRDNYFTTDTGIKITLTCISPEAKDLLDRIMEEWEKYEPELKKLQGERYQPSTYQFAYWLVRHSGLIQPS